MDVISTWWEDIGNSSGNMRSGTDHSTLGAERWQMEAPNMPNVVYDVLGQIVIPCYE